jgi:hypothetical protein
MFIIIIILSQGLLAVDFTITQDSERGSYKIDCKNTTITVSASGYSETFNVNDDDVSAVKSVPRKNLEFGQNDPGSAVITVAVMNESVETRIRLYGSPNEKNVNEYTSTISFVKKIKEVIAEKVQGTHLRKIFRKNN